LAYWAVSSFSCSDPHSRCDSFDPDVVLPLGPPPLPVPLLDPVRWVHKSIDRLPVEPFDLTSRHSLDLLVRLVVPVVPLPLGAVLPPLLMSWPVVPWRLWGVLHVHCAEY
ncbi:MAG: hypothetical protein ACK56I_25930, partial [bacterium]